MSAVRWVAGAVIAAAVCVGPLAGPAAAKISGTSGDLIAYERSGDIRVMSDQGAAVLDVNITNNAPGVLSSTPSWALPDDQCNPQGGPFVATRRTLVYASRPSGGRSDIIAATLTGNPPLLASTVDLTATASADSAAPKVGVSTDPDTGAQLTAIVFTRGPVGSRHLWAMRLDGSGATQLTFGTADDSSPDWSSDAKSVVYATTDAAGTRQLAIIDVTYDPAQVLFAAGPPRLVTAGPQTHGDPSWWSRPPGSPNADTARLLETTSAQGTTYLDFLEQAPASLATGPLFAPASLPAPVVRQLTGDPGGDLAASWRPEGDYVVFESDRARPGGSADIYRVRVDGTQLVRLTQDSAGSHSPDWEPNHNSFCLDPTPYSPRPGTPPRTGRTPPVTPPPDGAAPVRPQTPPPTPTPPHQRAPALSVGEPRVSTAGTGGRRTVTVRFAVNRAASAALVLRRSGRAVAAKTQTLSAGSAVIRLRVPRRALSGRYTLRLTVTAGGQSFNRSLSVKLR